MLKEKWEILAVDDNAANLTTLNTILTPIYQVYLANSGRRAISFLHNTRPDLIILDIEMPDMNGYAIIESIKNNSQLSDIPIIFLTGIHDFRNETQAFELGAVDYIQKPINATVLLARVKVHLELEAYRKNLENLVDRKTEQLQKMQSITLQLLAQVTESRDENTGGHIKRTSAYVACIMDALREKNIVSYEITKEFCMELARMAPLHDIGKVSIPDTVLLKPGKLTDEEFDIMKTHTKNGGALLKSAMDENDDLDFLKIAYDIVISHHEKWDGSGYPYGLHAQEIPLSGRIMAVADVYDALTTERPYKKAMAHDAAMHLMGKLQGNHFDPVIFDVFAGIEDHILFIKEKYGEETTL